MAHLSFLPDSHRLHWHQLAWRTPDRDGVILQDGDHRGLFLPSVWDRVPKPAQFVRQLKRKADLPPDHWSDTLRVFRYSVESFGAPFRPS